MNTIEITLITVVVVVAIAIVAAAATARAKASKATTRTQAQAASNLQPPGLFVEGLFEGLDQAAAEVAKRTAAGFREQALSYLSKTPPADPKP